MDGPNILVRSLSAVKEIGNKGYSGQYHSRSDRHSKAVCWAILFDLLNESSLLRQHAEAGKVVCGVNHEMSDYKAQRKKNLDLVIATPGTPDPDSKRQKHSFKQLVELFGISLTAEEIMRLDALPDVSGGPVGSVLLALEAKACMTAHLKALPRLYDELNSSQLTIHGSEDRAIAAGLAMVNISDSFISSDKNPLGLCTHEPILTYHRQPKDAERTVNKLRELPRRTRPGEEGFDALGIILVSCVNDGSPVTLATRDPAPNTNDDYHYDQMVRRAGSLYDHRFQGL